MTEQPLGRDGVIWEVSRLTGTRNMRAAEGKTKKGFQEIVSVPISGPQKLGPPPRGRGVIVGDDVAATIDAEAILQP
jgi:hypothetical protein